MIEKNDARAVSVVSSAVLASAICCERVSVFMSTLLLVFLAGISVAGPRCRVCTGNVKIPWK